MSNNSNLVSKKQLSHYFRVSMTSVNHWLDRGMPSVKQPDGSFGDHYLFDLSEVVDWRRQQAAQGRPQGGRDLENMPEDCWRRPEWDNGLRYLVEQSVWSFCWHFLHHDGGLNLVANLLAEARGEPDPRGKDVTLIGYALVDSFTSWLMADKVNAEIAASGTGGGIDGLYQQMTGRKVATSPPRDEDDIRFPIPGWLCELNREGDEGVDR